MVKSHLLKFLLKYPNQWHSYATDYETRKQVNNLLKKNIKSQLPFLIITNTDQMFYEIKRRY
jgi:hypothetical protein